MTERDDLHEQCRALLARMSVLSDARGVSFIPTGAGGGKKQSTGTAGPGSRDGDQDLFGKWAARFADPANTDRLPSLILLAGRDLALRTRRKPVQIGAQGEREDTWERDSRIIDWYADVPAEEAAIMESASGTYCPANNIRRVRMRNDRDPAHGLPQAPPESRLRLAAELAARGWGARKVAREMNVALSTAQGYLKALERQQAA